MKNKRNNTIFRLRAALSKACGLALCLLLCCSTSLFAASSSQPTIAIIIDDMGHNFQQGYKLAKMPYPLTLSFLPGRKHSQTLADIAAAEHKEIMLHVPMENTLGFSLGHGALTSAMSENELKQSLLKSLHSIPHIVGINNHMGSLLTTRRDQMRWVMESLQGTPYFFVDSRTSAASVAAKTARNHGIPSLTRDIFLDHEQNTSFLRKQFSALITIARRKGSAIAIAHPHRVTVDFLRRALPDLGKQGIAIATASGIWQLKHPYTVMHSEQKLGQRFAMREKHPSPHQTATLDQ
jgi:uncharacterized protein